MVTCAVGLVAALPGAEAQQAGKVPRVGFLWTSSPELTTRPLDAFRQGLREAGYIEGKNIAIEHRWAADVAQRLPDLASELVRNKVDIVVTQGTPAAQAAKRATTTIPIVMAVSGDAVATGLVASLARPGGNITGLTLLPELIGKRLELLKEAIPKARRIAVIVDAEPRSAAAARALGSQLQILEVRGHSDFEKAFEAATKARAEALVVSQSPILRFYVQSFVDLAAKNRLPAIYQRREFVEAGGLMAYGPRDADLFRRAAVYVDKVLKGAKPADLPVEQPMRLELVINLRTAKALGLTIPPSVLARADEVIE
jgi:putative ABC transport system substrate-binding protein